jgi:hypothetical protein
MKNLDSMTGKGVAISAAVVSVAWAFVFPAGYPWPSVAWAILACAVVVAMIKTAHAQPPTMNDVIRGVDAEPARATVHAKTVVIPATTL